MSALEALCNAVIGFVVSWCATLFVLGYSPAAVWTYSSPPPEKPVQEVLF
jgi:hypothetical protein